MSLPRRSRAHLWQAATFRWVLTAALVFVLTSLALIWAAGGLALYRIDQAERTRLAEFTQVAEALFEDGGQDALIAEIRDDEEIIWHEDYIYEILEQDALVIVLRDADYEAIAGYPGLWADEDGAWIWLDHEAIDDPLYFAEIWFEDDSSATIASFVPDRYYGIQELLWFSAFALMVIVAPLTLLTGIWLSRRVFRRIERLSQTADLVAAGDLSQRAQELGTDDEFDRLSGGINRMLDQIQTLTSNIEAVSVGVAHDLKTPLANIGGRLELMQRDLSDPAATSAHIEAAEGYLAQVLRIFDALLRLGEVEAGRRKRAFAVLSLSDLARDMAEAYGPVFEDAQKTLTVHTEPGGLVHGDRELLEQLLSNLLENVLEHARDAAQTFVSVQVVEGRVILRLGDDGPGIPPTDRDKIFDRFYRADSSRGTPGTGLGLALVKAISSLHEADLSLEEDTPGAVFVLDFALRSGRPR